MERLPQIILHADGHTYLGIASKFCFNDAAQKLFKQLLASNDRNDNKFFVVELEGKEVIIKAAQRTVTQALKYFTINDTNRALVHFSQWFI